MRLFSLFNKTVLLFFLSVICTSLYGDNIQENTFDIKSANQQLIQIQKQVPENNMSLKSLQSTIGKLEQLKGEANICIESTQIRLDLIEKLIKSIPSGDEIKSTRKDFTYLNEQKKTYETSNGECRVFIYRIDDELIKYRDVAQSLTTQKVLKRSTTILNVFSKDIQLTPINYNKTELLKNFELKFLIKINLKLIIALVFLSILLGISCIYFCKIIIKRKIITSRLLTPFLTTLKLYIIPLLILLSFYLQKSPLLESSMEANSNGISLILIYYTLGLFAVNTLFYPLKPAASALNLTSNWGRRLFIKSATLFTLLLIGYLYSLLVKPYIETTAVAELGRAFYVVIITAAATWLAWSLTKLPYQWISTKIKFYSQLLLLAIFTFIVLVELSGYHNLAIFIINSFLLTLLILVLVWVVISLMNLTIFHIIHSKKTFMTKFRNYLGLKKGKSFFEVKLLRFVVYTLLAYISIVLLLNIWGFSDNLINTFENVINEGIIFTAFKIYPARIYFAIVVFGMVLLAGRVFTTIITRKYKVRKDESSRIALTSLLAYVIFAIAIIFALIVAGIDLTGLYVVAGALFVGIGLGLQDIVKNFFSGIILLLEKQIKPTDRIVIGNTEGYVEKINVRSTHVRTLDRDDVIIPNSELMSTQVVNYMLQDHYWRVHNQVGVAYGSDTKLVKQLLLDIAYQHPNVIKEPPNEPKVHFLSFDDSSLLFELRSIIEDVNKKTPIRSDLNFAIEETFRMNNIEIAFPQCDIHIKEIPPKNGKN